MYVLVAEGWNFYNLGSVYTESGGTETSMYWLQKYGTSIFLVHHILEPLYPESGVLEPLGSGCKGLELLYFWCRI